MYLPCIFSMSLSSSSRFHYESDSEVASESSSDDSVIMSPPLENHNLHHSSLSFNFPLFFGMADLKFSFRQQHHFTIINLLLSTLFIFLMVIAMYFYFPLSATSYLVMSVVSTLFQMRNIDSFCSGGHCSGRMIWMAALTYVGFEILIFTLFVGIGWFVIYLFIQQMLMLKSFIII